VKKRIHTDHAPAAIGPYSQAIVLDNMVYTAGQIAIDPHTGNLVEGGIEAQTGRALTNLTAVLRAAGTSTLHVVKTTVFLASMDDFAAMNSIYAKFFDPEMPPARTTIQAGGLPRNALVEIECVAAIDPEMRTLP
jgi:2-iminobutanoate/2-iminopropanoate deaminase